jgi:murein L,D-transpeptidase YcbB/YkuD
LAAAPAARAAGPAPSGAAPTTLQRCLLGGTAAGERLLSQRDLRLFYEARGQRPAWVENGRISPQADNLLAALRTADREGLNPAEYHSAAIATLLGRLRSPQGRSAPAVQPAADAATADLDLLLSDAFFLYAAHLTAGRVEPELVEPEWNIDGRGRDLVQLLAAALNHSHLAVTLAALPPAREDYRRLRDALAAQRAIAAAGGWPLVPWGPKLREGERHARVAALRRRLAATGELPSGSDLSNPRFDRVLAAALRRFQNRHGLEADGIAGSGTLAALNTPASERAHQIEANLERLRWLPLDLGPRYLLVNIADFNLVLTEAGAPSLQMRVIVGRQLRRTPFFTGEITSILFNPSWTVPEKLAIEDKLPLILDDPYYLEDHGYKVFKPAGAGWLEVDPARIPWARLSKDNFPYQLRQDPGPGNALGQVKFQIPNRHDIYLHDTPSHELFARRERSFSSGCIRVERAVDLAARLLASDPAWKRARIEATIADGATVSVPLAEPLTTYLLYWTAWVDGNGALQLREDVYGSDRALLAALALPLRAH